jgi:hypothetical protein
MRVLRARLGESLAGCRNQMSAVIAYGESATRNGPGGGPLSATTVTRVLGVAPR